MLLKLNHQREGDMECEVYIDPATEETFAIADIAGRVFVVTYDRAKGPLTPESLEPLTTAEGMVPVFESFDEARAYLIDRQQGQQGGEGVR